jgi:hypothetical protein
MDITNFFGKKTGINKIKKKKNIYSSKYGGILLDLVDRKIIDLLEYKIMLDLSLKGIIIHNNYFLNICNRVYGLDNLNSNFKKKFVNIIKEEYFQIKFLINENIKISKKNIIKKCFKMNDKLTFTHDQKIGIERIIKFLTNKNKCTYGLYGYAGTGKTTLIVNLISFLIKNRFINSVVFTAPTNKAVNIMKSKFRIEINKLINDHSDITLEDNSTFEEKLRIVNKLGYNINFITIHKLLNYKNKFNSSGEKVFIKGDNNTVNRYDLIIMDECSMLSMQVIIHLFDEVNKLKKDISRISVPKILFVGDPAQLPPVNEKNSSIFIKDSKNINFKLFYNLLNKEKYDDEGYYNEIPDEEVIKEKFINFKKNIINLKKFTLKEIVRSNNNNILNVCMNIRDWVLNKIKIPKLNQLVGEGVKIISKKSNKNEFIQHFIDNINNKKNKINNNIILTWTNRVCNQYNNTIRRKIFNKKKLEKFEIGDILILNDFYNFNEINDKESENRFYTSEQIKIINLISTQKGSNTFSSKLTKSAKRLKSNQIFKLKVKKLVNLLNANTNRIFNVWKLEINKITDIISNNKVNKYVIYVVKDKDKDKLEKEKEFCRKRIGELRDYFFSNYKEIKEQIDLYIIRPLWEQYSKIFNEPFANVNYGYCTTVHKSQGSTYYNVYIDLEDILNNSNVDEMKRCMYTSVTRSSNSLVLIL